MPKPLTRRERSLAAKYRRLVKAKERAAVQYELADRLAFEIATKSNGKEIRISDTKGIRVIDVLRAAFDHPKRKPHEMPKMWAHSAVRPYEIEEVKLTVE